MRYVRVLLNLLAVAISLCVALHFLKFLYSFHNTPMQSPVTSPVTKSSFVISSPLPELNNGRRIVYVIDSGTYQPEIVIPAITTLSDLRDIDLTFFTAEPWSPRSGAEPYHNRHINDSKPLTEFSVGHDIMTPDLILLLSCPEDVRALQHPLHHMLHRGARVMCVVREAHKWSIKDSHSTVSSYEHQINFIKPWVLNRQFDFLTLSDYAQRYVQENFPEFLGTGPDVKYNSAIMYPAFIPSGTAYTMSLDLPRVAITTITLENIVERYVFQQPATIFKVAEAYVDRKDLFYKDNMKGKSALSLRFAANIKNIGQSIAAISAFDGDENFESRTSMAIAASMIAGTPLVVSRKLQKYYDFPLGRAVWIQNYGESEREVVKRIFEAGSREWRTRKIAMVLLREQLIMRNFGLFEEILGVDRY
ncbi:uncharacterized protein V2V93DRAFT_369578 [Kockiozyma suomiensis]|uniref:uncharacterized protein n=1 Tax=Kockiozyma suomiensis TaxID=1337062 RepID=UPI00334368D2